MSFKTFDTDANKERSDQLADLLKQAGVRFKQRVVAETGRRSLHVIAVHRDDMSQAQALYDEMMQQKCEAFVRNLRFVRQPYIAGDMLISREPNEAGFSCSGAYHGEPFDETRFRLVKGGWDHAHCYLCFAKVEPGDEWWAALPSDEEEVIGLCLACHARLFWDKIDHIQDHSKSGE